jgi:hypothetical protein
MSITLIKPYNLDTTANYTFNQIVASSAIINGNDISSGGGPKITNIQVTDSSYNVLDDTAVSISGGYIKITGTGFASACQVLINNTPATSTTFVSATEVRAQVPATAAGTYVVYLVNTDGGVAIRVNGITFSGTPTWSTSSTLPSGGVDISIQLVATGDGTVTYSLAAGSSLPTGVTLSSSGLLSGTVTGITGETTYSFTIIAIDSELQDSPRTFSITVTFSDTNFPYVTTLFSANTATLPYDSDASNNSFVITPNGDARPNNFNPYTPGYYSNYFDGTGDYLTLPTSQAALQPGSGDFTIEFWYYTSTTPSNYINLFSYNSTGDALRLFLYTTNALQLWTGATQTIVSANDVHVANRWNHVAIARVGTTITMYMNGTSIGTATNSTNYVGNLNIAFESGQLAFTGYISNFRVVKGTALYTSAFTPPTTPLTAVSNTSLLTCQSNRFIDTSNNSFTITRNGDVKVEGFDPFVPAAEFAARGSTYFDGTGDYLTIADTANIQPGTGDCTWEAWIYPLSLPSAGNYKTLWAQRNNSDEEGGAAIVFNSSGNYQYFIANAAANAWQVSGGSTGFSVLLNQWQHVALVRSGNTMTMYLNGVAGTTASVSTGAIGTSGNLTLMAGATNGIQTVDGYMSNFRFVKGTAVYTSTFTPSTSPLTAVANTNLLTCQTNQPDNNNIFIDNSTNNFLVTRNGNTTQGTFSPYGALWSNYFDGTGDCLSLSNSAMTLGSGDFTIEMWVYLNALPTSNDWPGAFNNCASLVSVGTLNAADGFNCIIGSTQMFCQNNDTKYGTALHGMVVGTWYHLAYVRSGNTIYFYVNGVQKGSVAFTGSIGTGAFTWIGCESGQGAYINGYMSNVRVVKGTALYTTTFTPSTSPLTAVANTSLLTCTDNRFIDDSPNNFTITRSGDVSVQRFSPFSPQTANTFYSGYFDGDGDSLTVPASTAFSFGTADFTVECWVYYPSISNTNGKMVIDARPTSTNGSYWNMGAGSTGIMAFTTMTVSGTTVSDTVARPNQWVHYAATRSGTNLRLFANGTLVASAIDSSNISSSGLRIGTNAFSGAATDTFWLGYISNVRIIKGTALYTSTFTPSTSPLTAVSNTSLLTCQSATFIDNSTNNFTITVNGNSRPTTVAPFTSNTTTGVDYSPSVYGGSMYFDGTGDYLSCSNSALAMGTGSFTWEAWIYWTTGSGYRQIFSTRTTNGSSTAQGSLALVATTNYLVWYTNAAIITTSVAVPSNTWAHIAVVRNGTSLVLYLNGINVGSATNSDNLTASVFSIGANNDGSEPFAGYISNVRVIRGQAIYTSNFAPPTAPLTAVRNTSLLLNGTSAGIYDSSMMNNYETVGNTSLVTNIEKYGNSSLYFDGTGDYMLVAPNVNLEFGSGDFTIEFWLYRVGSGRMALYHGSFGTDWSVGIDISSVSPNTSNTIGIWASSNGTSWNLINADSGGNGIGTIAVAQNTWTHIAYVRNGTTWMSFINGVRDRNITGVSGSIVNRATSQKAIGAWFSDPSMAKINGYINDFRITKGIARYTANFTPSSLPFNPR